MFSRPAGVVTPRAQAGSSLRLAKVWDTSRGSQPEGYRDLVAELCTKAPVRRGSRSQATDLLFVLLSPDLYRALVLERGLADITVASVA